MSSRPLVATFAATLALALSASAQTLGVGDPAPRLQVGEWLQGEPVGAFEKGKPYVVEFWATWCGPCKVSIPHIDALAKQHAEQGLTVIGVSVWEENPALVKPFVERMQEKMTYRVARDTVVEGDRRGENGFMAKTWMEAAGQTGIPAAFLIDREGRVAWIGHPMEMDEPLAAVVAGTWDLEAAKARAAAARLREARLKEYDQRIGAALSKGDFAGAVAAMDELFGLDPQLLLDYAPVRLDLALKTDDLDGAYAWARKTVREALWDSAPSLNGLAWLIVDPQRPHARRDLELAALAAERAAALTEHADPGVLHTLARVRFGQGKLEEAVELQRKAIASVDDPELARQLTPALEEYLAALGTGGQGSQ